MNIILVGLPGAGKSTFGKRLAHRLSLDFFDLDDLIVTSQQKSINQIFSEQGEEVFRNIEHQTLSNFCEQHDHYLLSTGGGTPCFRDNMSLIKSVGYSIFLNPPLEIIIERVSNNDKRPLLAGEDAAVKIRALYQARVNFYNQADRSLDPTDISDTALSDLSLDIKKAVNDRF